MRRLLLALSLVASAASARTVEDEQAWLNLTVMGSIRNRLVYFAEAQPRFGDGVSRLDALLLRPAIGWKVSDRVTLYQGYARVITPIAGGTDRREHRSFQQLSWTLASGKASELSSRTRLEQRWRNDGRDTGWRLREFLRYEQAFDRSGKGLRALGYAEAFVALDGTDWGQRQGFDQLRTFVGVEVPVKGRTTMEIGYLNQLVNQPAGNFRMAHVAAISLWVRH